MVTAGDLARFEREKAGILALCEGEWVLRSEIGMALRIGEVTMRKRIGELELEEKIATRRTMIAGRWRSQHRAVGPDYIPPLYESTADHLPLASCWGGYTVKTRGEQVCRA